MKVKIKYQDKEIIREVNEIYRKLFPMHGCEGISCDDCPFENENCYAYEYLGVRDSSVFTAEIIEEKEEIKFEDLKLNQVVYVNNIEQRISGLVCYDDAISKVQFVQFGRYTILIAWDEIKDRVSLTPPKKKIKKEIKGWVNIYKYDEGFQCEGMSNMYDKKENADKVTKNRIACVEMTGSYEVEE